MESETYWLIYGKNIKPKNASVINSKTKYQAILMASIDEGITYTLARTINIIGKSSGQLTKDDDVWLISNKEDNNCDNIIIFCGDKTKSIENYVTMSGIKTKNVGVKKMNVEKINKYIKNKSTTIQIDKPNITDVEKLDLDSLLEKIKCNNKYLVHHNRIDNDYNIFDTILFIDYYMDIHKMIIKKYNEFSSIIDIHYEIGNTSYYIYLTGIWTTSFMSVSYHIFGLNKHDRSKLSKAIHKSFLKKGHDLFIHGLESFESSEEDPPKKIATKNKSTKTNRKKIISESSESDSS